MKKLLVVLGSIGLGVAPISTVTSCFGSPKDNIKEKIELTEDSLSEWISNQQFGYEGDFYFLDGNEINEDAYRDIFDIFVYKIQNVISDELNKTFKSNDLDLWNIYVWVRQSENKDIINEENGFKSQKNYQLKYELTITNKNPENKIEKEFKDLVFNFKQTNTVSPDKLDQVNLENIVENFKYYKNNIHNPFNWGGRFNSIFDDVKKEIIAGKLNEATSLLEVNIDNYSTGKRSRKIPFEAFYFTSVINKIYPYEEIKGTEGIQGSDKIKFKVSATSTFFNLEGKLTIDWESIYII